MTITDTEDGRQVFVPKTFKFPGSARSQPRAVGRTSDSDCQSEPGSLTARPGSKPESDAFFPYYYSLRL